MKNSNFIFITQLYKMNWENRKLVLPYILKIESAKTTEDLMKVVRELGSLEQNDDIETLLSSILILLRSNR